MDARLIAFNAPKGGGKDTLCRVMKEELPFEVRRFAFADELKTEVAEKYGLDLEFMLYGTSEEKDTKVSTLMWGDMDEKFKHNWDALMTYREVLQYYGTEICRELDKDIWVNKLRPKVEEYLAANPYNVAVITDLRYDNESDMVHQLGGTVIRIDSEVLTEASDHASEQLVDDYDYVIKGRGKAREAASINQLSKVLWSCLGCTL